MHPRSRRSSVVSNNSGFNLMRFGKTKKSSANDDDDDDDDKDVIMDSSTATMMSFDDLSSIRDRGRYGLQQQTFDTAPIIPTVQTPGSRPISGASNTQYRKQMTAMKKQAYSQAGKMAKNGVDQRGMSLQMMSNPYMHDSSMQQYPDPRSNSFNTMHPPPHFMQGQGPPRPGSRANSLTTGPPPSMNNPRAYSLTSNPYQHGSPMQGHPRPPFRPQQRPPQQTFPPGPGPPPPQQRQQQGFLHPQPHRLSASSLPPSANGGPSGMPSTALQNGGLPPQGYPQQKRTSLSQQVYPPLDSPTNPAQTQLHTPPASAQSRDSYQNPGEQLNTLPHGDQSQTDAHTPSDGLSHSQPGPSWDSPSQAHAQAQAHHLSPLQERPNAATRPVNSSATTSTFAEQKPLSNGRVISDEKAVVDPTLPTAAAATAGDASSHPYSFDTRQTSGSSTLDPGRTPVLDSNHHFLAEKTIAADDNSTTSINETSFPNGESTPSPDFERTGHASTAKEAEVSPSKLPRIKALPRLSVLSIKDDDDDDDDIDLNKQRVLEPVTEDSSVPESYSQSHPQSNTPPPGQSYFKSPEKSPPKRPMSSRISPHKHMKNAVSISSMSEYSAVSDSQADLNENSKRLYQLSGVSNTNNDVFVTASQFSFMDGQKRNSGSVASASSSATDPDATPKLQRRSVDETSIKSPGSFKGFLKNLSIKKKKQEPIFETVTKQIPLKEPELSSDFTTNSSSVASKPDTLAESFVPHQAPRLGLTVDQLGIMEEKSSIMRELDLVSRELAASINREIALEEQINGGSKVQLPSDHLSQSLEVSQLLQQLNEERKKRYIAEEHVLLLEAGQKPSALELSYENDKLKSELSLKEELVNQQQNEINLLKKDVPELKSRLELVMAQTKEYETEILPKLKNEVEILRAENKNVSILREKVKILKNENAQLEGSNGLSFVSTAEDFNFNQPTRTSSPKRSSKRLASFNLISITSSESDSRT